MLIKFLSVRSKYTLHSVYSLHFHFQNLHLYSTNSPIQNPKSPNQIPNSPNQIPKSPNQSYTNYLIDHLGFSHEQALSATNRLRSKYVNYSKFSNNANSVIDFLKQHHFDDAHIVKVVSYFPRILAANVDQTLKPRIKFFQDRGFSGSDLVTLISSSPSCFLVDMDHLDDLRAFLGSNENILKLIARAQYYLTTSGIKNLISNIALLNNEYGVDIDVIRNDILRHPRSVFRTSTFFRNVLVRVEEELGIPRTSGMFLYGMQILCGFSKKCIDSKCELFKSLGWTEYDVSEVKRRNPLIFTHSEQSIRKKSEFLMTELGYKPDYLATHSVLLGLSLENRLVPRHRVLLVLKEKGLLDYGFYSAAVKSEAEFLKILIEPFKEAAPYLLELYQNNKGYSNTDAISSHQ